MKEKLCLAMDIGEQMLVCGAEVHRVEDSVKRICEAFGAVRTDVFIITSSMVVTVQYGEGDTCTQTRRITSTGTDFEKIHRLNALSRKICADDMTVSQIREELAHIVAVNTYPLWAECVCYAVISGAFALFFGGGGIEAAVAFAIGAQVRLVITAADKAISNKIFSKFIASFTATALAFAALKLGWVPTVDKTMIGIIMTLIPGIGLTNALRDLFTGDSIAGLLRSIEAVLSALAIAAGYFLFAALGGVIG
ncbi:MAG: threonine/serine exporter family protein [Clostridia bacterium]|nr:threonine/serine exporter family protein [Clostridia bacterium]